MPTAQDAAAAKFAGQPHVVLVPVPAQGHITPFNTIAHYLSSAGISVTLVLSALTHSALSPLPSDASHDQSTHSLIRIEVVAESARMPSSDPKQPFSLDNFRNTVALLRQGVEQLLEKLMQEVQPPCCLLMDGLLGWGYDVALKFALPWMDVWTSSATVFSIAYHLPDLVAKGYIPASRQGLQKKIIDFIPGVFPFTIAHLPESVYDEEGLQSPSFQFFLSMLKHSKRADRVLVNTIHELESSALHALSQDGVRMHPVGPLFMFSASFSSAPANLLQEDKACLPWLDKRQKSSVLYISFGSIASVEEHVFVELAHGLEASGESFLWVVRPDTFAGKASVEELFPEGFMERTRDRGLVISWAPQLAVLGHPSVGAFLTHCGWNSILESLSNGVPMLGFPQQGEQNTNLTCIVSDWKVGLPLLHPDAQSAGKVDRSHVQCVVTSIMSGQEGAHVRKRALALRDVAHRAPHGTSKSNLQMLVDDLKHGHLKCPSEDF